MIITRETRNWKLLSLAALLLAFPVLTFAATAVPTLINFQGRLLDQNKLPRNGTFTMDFAACDAPAAGDCVSYWTETQSVSVTNGVFAVQLGAVTPLAASVFSNSARYLSITVAGETLSPRERLVTGPYAFRSSVAEQVTGFTGNKALVSDAGGNAVAHGSVTDTEVGYLSGVTSSIQTQLNAAQPAITGGATSIVSSNLALNKALASDGSGKVVAGAVTDTELGYVGGVTSAIQTQLNDKLALTPVVSQTVNYSADVQTIFKMNAAQSAAPFAIKTSAAANKFVVDVNGDITTGGFKGTAVDSTYGGTGVNSSAATGMPKVAAGVWSVNATQDDLGNGTTYKQYDPSNVAITGGSVNNTTVGATTRNTGAFTTVDANATGNAVVLSGAGATLAFTGAGVAQITSANNQHIALMPAGTGNVGIGTTGARAALDIVSTDALIPPSGTTAQQPASPVAGMIRYNSSIKGVETYHGNTPGWTGIVSNVNAVTYCAAGCTGATGATYTPPVNLLYATVECIGGGGGGGGVNATVGAAAGGGGGGGYARETMSYATITSGGQLITVGTGGLAGTNAGGNGGLGNTSSFGALLSCAGGSGGTGSTAATTKRAGGAGGAGSLGTVNINGDAGSPSFAFTTAAGAASGKGGSSSLGGGGAALAGATGAGNVGSNYGGGGGGAMGGTANIGGVGGPGIVIITEYLAGAR